MSQGVVITIIICSTIAFLGLCGIGVAIYAIKKGMGFAEKECENDRIKEKE
ncbi:hypothetical protein KAW50_08640 [candidate division WOR-3 bacterium]|nr:hypothetical protein [candidate division WOR-3 bacterium]